MPRPSRQLQPGYSYHVTTCCNNREFRLTRLECRQVLLYAIKKAQDKYRFQLSELTQIFGQTATGRGERPFAPTICSARASVLLYGLCIMSNHVHYLREPAQPKPEKRNHWGSRLLAGLKIKKGKPKKTAPGQMAFPWAQWETPDSQVQEVAEKFVFANCYNPQAAGVSMRRCQVSES